MWVKLRHIKRIGFTLVLLLIVSIILELTSSLIFALKQQDFYSDYYSANKSGIVKIVDNYDTSNTDIFDFLDEPEALEKLETMYDRLINNKIIKYYEIATQSIEFIGNYEKSLNLVVNDDISNINQEVLVDILHINIILSSFIPINIIFTNVICSVLIKNNFWHEIFTMYKWNLAVYNAILLILYTILNNIIYKNKKSSIFN